MSEPNRASIVPAEPQTSRGPQAELITPTPLEVLRDLARPFNGTAMLSLVFFGPPVLRGHHQGRALKLTWAGDQAHLAMPAPPGQDVRIERAPAWRRWLFGETLRTAGDSRRLIDAAMELVPRFGLTRFVVENGSLEASGSPGLSAPRIKTMVLALHDLVWRESTGRARRVEPEPVAGSRCPFCHDDLTSDAPVVHCAACDAPHHPSCFEEGEGCSIGGCGERKARGRKTG